jgi:hypothetical protein
LSVSRGIAAGVAGLSDTELRQRELADIYVMSRPNIRYKGVVDSVGFVVTPDTDRTLGCAGTS